MRRELIEILACPVCKGALTLSVGEEDKAEIVSGSLYCSGCQVAYAIVDTIPNLLPPDRDSESM